MSLRVRTVKQEPGPTGPSRGRRRRIGVVVADNIDKMGESILSLTQVAEYPIPLQRGHAFRARNTTQRDLLWRSGRPASS